MYLARNKKTGRLLNIAILGFIAVLAIAGPFSVAHAATVPAPPDAPQISGTDCSWHSPSSWPICAVEGITAIIGGILKIVLDIFAWLLEIVIQMNEHIVDTPSVQLGYSITLSIANLGFVLGIIVVALATILRSQTYGIKQILTKLIIMAILVNFGLVLAGVVIHFTDVITKYFSDAITNYGITNFSAEFAAAFAPQKASGGQTGATAGNWFSQVFAACVAIGMVGLAVGAFAVTLVMFLIRYVYLGILLIVLPFAWMASVFPNFKNVSNKWWSEFTKWVFFGPAAMFFIYLAITVWVKRKDFLDAQINAASKLPGSAATAINTNVSWLQSFFVNFTTTVGEQLIIAGLMYGGLMAASSVSSHAANVTLGAVKGAGNVVKGYAGSFGKRRVREVLQTKRASSMQQKLQAGEYRGIPKRVQTTLGRWTASAERAGGGEQVAAHEKKATELVKKDPKEVARLLQNEAGVGIPGLGKGINKEEQMAFLGQALANENVWKEVQKSGKVGGKEITRFLKENETDFTSRHQEELLKGLKVKTGLMLTELNDTIKTEKGKKEVQDALTEQADFSGRKKLGRALTPAENDKFIANEKILKDLREAEEKRDALMKKSPEVVANAFQDDDLARRRLQADGKPVPITLEPGSVKDMREAFAGSFATWSPSNVRSSLEAVAKIDGLKQLEAYLKDLKAGAAAGVKDKKELFDKIKAAFNNNKQLQDWSDRSTSKALIDLKDALI